MHAERAGVLDKASERAIMYLQWSAAEKIALLSSGSNISASPLGRGRMPKPEFKSLAQKSSTLPVEHVIWTMATQEDIDGNDLYATLWATLAST